MDDTAPDVVKGLQALIDQRRPSGWWKVFYAGVGVALIFALVTVSIIALDRGTQVADYRAEARCRSDVSLALILGVVDVVDELATTPRSQPDLDVALRQLHVVRKAAKDLQASRKCGYSGAIPSPDPGLP